MAYIYMTVGNGRIFNPWESILKKRIQIRSTFGREKDYGWRKWYVFHPDKKGAWFHDFDAALAFALYVARHPNILEEL